MDAPRILADIQSARQDIRMDTLTPKIATAVRDDMSALGVSESQLAIKSGISRVTLRRRLAGTSPFTIAELAAVASVLHCSPSRYVLAAESADAA